MIPLKTTGFVLLFSVKVSRWPFGLNGNIKHGLYHNIITPLWAVALCLIESLHSLTICIHSRHSSQIKSHKSNHQDFMKGSDTVLRSPSGVPTSLVETTRSPNWRQRLQWHQNMMRKDIDPDKTVIVCKGKDYLSMGHTLQQRLIFFISSILQRTLSCVY